MSAELRLSLFGGFEARRSGQALTGFESGKARALLAYLATMPGIAQQREGLCALLWPELEHRDARHNLSQVLSNLRNVLGDRAATAPVLLADRHSVQLNRDASIRVDVLAFEQLLERCRSHAHARPRDCASCAGWRREAAGLYGGDFLQGLSVGASPAFDDWTALQRERWHRQALDGLRWLANYHEARGELADAELFCRRQVALEPWREQAHRQLMRVLARGGQRTAALAQYAVCQQALADAFGVAPEAETTAFYRHLQQAEDSRMMLLPKPVSSFIGREHELAELSALLAHPERRLLTIVGPGGCGKTQLALALARRVEARFLDGVAAVFLADVSDADRIDSALVAALALPYGEGEALTRAQDYLREKEALLVLDNCEHLPAAGNIAGQLLPGAPGLKIVATSRHPLRLAAEARYPLGGLPVVLPSDDASGAPGALYLFEEAARRVRPDFTLDAAHMEDVLRICGLVDGLPLALEMAAAWVRAMSCAAIVAEIQRSHDFLVADATDVPARHHSMRAVWNHSWKLLTPPERTALVRLTVFRGGFTREALVAVTGAKLADVTALLDKSLLQQFEPGRYAMHELVRQFASARWANESESLRTATRHSEYYLAMIAEQTIALGKADVGPTRRELKRELENIRQAWQHAAGSERWEALAAATEGLAAFFRLEGLVADGADAFGLAAEQVSLRAGEAGLSSLLTRLLTHRARFLLDVGRTEEAATTAQEALRLAGEAGDQGAVAAARLALGQVHEFLGQCEAAEQVYEQALRHYEATQDERGVAEARGGLGNVRWHHSEYAAALEYFHAALAIDRRLENQRGVARHLTNLGIVYWERSEFVEALSCLEEAMSLATAMGHREHIGRTSHNIGLIYWRLGKREEALTAYKRAATIADELGLRRGIVVANTNIGNIERECGRYAEALSHYRRAISLAREIGFNYALAHALGNVANLYRDMGHYEQAWPYYEEAVALDEAAGNREGVGRHWGEIGRWYVMQQNDACARGYLEQAIERLREVGSTYNLASLMPELAGVLLRQGEVDGATAVNEEGQQLAVAVGHQEVQVQAAIVAANIAYLGGDSNGARDLLHEALRKAAQPEFEAALTYALWETTGELTYARRSWQLYQELAATPKVMYRERHAALHTAVRERRT